MKRLSGWRRKVSLVGGGLCMVLLCMILQSALVSPLRLGHLFGGMPEGLMAPAIAQPFNRRAIAQEVHNQIPDLPLENHYINTETGEVDSGNTLVHRLIQYHYDVKSRPLISRFDWKLTLADYLGANEWIDDERYPSRLLNANPYAADITAIRQLNRQQRDILVQTLVNTFANL